MPSGGEGYYYFSVYLLVRGGKNGFFDIEINESRLCTAYTEQLQAPNDEGYTGCSAVTYAVTGWCLLQFSLTHSVLTVFLFIMLFIWLR